MRVKCCVFGSDASASEGAGKWALLELVSDDKVGGDSWEQQCGRMKELWAGRQQQLEPRMLGRFSLSQPFLGSQSSKVLGLSLFPGQTSPQLSGMLYRPTASTESHT